MAVVTRKAQYSRDYCESCFVLHNFLFSLIPTFSQREKGIYSLSREGEGWGEG